MRQVDQRLLPSDSVGEIAVNKQRLLFSAALCNIPESVTSFSVGKSPLFLGVIYPALPLHEAGAVKNGLHV
jgi:hypothetical protein